MRPGVDSEKSEAPDHPNLQVERLGGQAKGRRIYWFNSISPSIRYGVHNNNILAIERAIKERLLFVKCKLGAGFTRTEKPIVNFSKSQNLFFMQFQKRSSVLASLGKHSFLSMYVGRKRTAYEKAFKSIQSNPVQRKDSYIGFFVKCEKINFTAKPDAAPRGISPRTPRYHVSVGPYIKRIEKKIYNMIADIYGAPTVCKGFNAQRRGAVLRSHWDDFNDPVAVGLDASRFDQHVSADALKFEHSIYKLFFPHEEQFHKLLNWQINNKFFARAADGNAKLLLHGGRMSGDMNTALGNCLLMCSMIYCYMATKDMKYRLVNDGDDCVLIFERKHLRRIDDLSWKFLELGFDMKVEPHVDVFEKIEFCQSQPVWTAEGWLMVRKVPHSLAKDAISIKPLNQPKLARKWCAAVGEGGMSLTGQIPIVQEYYQKFYDFSDGVKPLRGDPTQETGMSILAKGMKREYGPIHWMTRLSFWRAFGMSSHKQLVFEQVIKDIRIDLDVRPSLIPTQSLRI
nr:RNA polymerase [Flumine tombus-like virus 19]